MKIKLLSQLISIKGKSITFKLSLWFIAVSLIPLIVIGSIIYIVAEDTLLKHIYSELNIISNLKKRQIETYAFERKKDIEVVSKSFFIKDALNNFNLVFNKYGINSPQFQILEYKYRPLFRPFFENHFNVYKDFDILLINPKGDIIYNMLKNKELGTNLIQGSYKDLILSEVFKRSLTDTNILISEIGFSQPANKTVMFTAVSIIDKNKVIGVLALQINAAELYLKSIDYEGLGKTGEIILGAQKDNKITILSPLRFDPNAVFNRNIIVGSKNALPMQRAVNGEKGSGLFKDYRGKEVMAVWSRLKHTNWGIVVKIDKDDAYSTIYNLKHILITISIFTLFGVIIAIIIISKLISKPIISLTNSTKKIAEGNYTKYTNGSIFNLNDEIGELAESIKTMALKLKIRENQHIRYETELSLQRDILDEAQRIAHIGNWNWDITKNIVIWSKEMYNIYGVNPDTFNPVYNSINTFIHPDDISKADEILYDDKKFYTKDYRIILDNATIRYISAYVEVKIDPLNNDIYLVGTSQDITARKQLENELYNNMQLLIQQSKMATMGEMIGAIAHQWRQPLNAINLVAQDIEGAYKFGELNERYISKSIYDITQQVHFMSNTIDDFRNFFKPDKEKILFSVNNAIKEVFILVYDLIKKMNISLSLNCLYEGALNIKTECVKDDICSCKPEIKILGYPNEFKQVVLNIIANARDAIIERRANNLFKDKEKEFILIEILKDNDMVTIKFKDNGGGIPEGLIDKVFDQYVTSKKEGTGIGLYMSKIIIETNMDGKIKVKNIDNGAMLTLELKYYDI